jgi:hypothetical protein
MLSTDPLTAALPDNTYRTTWTRDERPIVTSELTTMTSRLRKPNDPRPAPWEQRARDLFVQRMLDRDRLFPCVFGVDAVKRETLRFTFVPGDAGIFPLAGALTEFVALAPSLGKRTSLVAFFEPDGTPCDLEGYAKRFWQILQDLHDADSQPWPGDIPADTEDPSWEFCFGGMPMFVVANTPAHEHRLSRHFEYLAITFQPRFVFDDIAADSPQGQNARKVINSRLRDYDSVPPTPLLGAFGSPGNREWTQYFLADDNVPVSPLTRCPFTSTPHTFISHTEGTK